MKLCKLLCKVIDTKMWTEKEIKDGSVDAD